MKRPPVATLIEVTNRYDPTKPFPWNVVLPNIERAIDNLGLVVGPDGGLCKRIDTHKGRREAGDAQPYSNNMSQVDGWEGRR